MPSPNKEQKKLEKELNPSKGNYSANKTADRWEYHRENIQILVALGFLGAYVSVLSNGMFESYSTAIDTFAFINIIYVGIKLNVIELLPDYDSEFVDKVNNWTRILFLISINGFLIGIIGWITVRAVDMPDISINPAIAIMSITVSFVFVILFLGSKRQIHYTKKTNKEIPNNLTEVLKAASDSGYISEGEWKTTVKRFGQVIEKDENIGTVAHFISAFFDGSLLTLLGSERNSVLTIVERMEIKLENNQFDKEDYEQLLSILRRAEKRK